MTAEDRDPYTPPESELHAQQTLDWRRQSVLELRREFGSAHALSAYSEDNRALLRVHRVGRDHALLIPGGPPRDTGYRLRLRLGIFSKRLTVLRKGKQLGEWRRRLGKGWTLVSAKDDRWVGASLRRGFWGPARLLDPQQDGLGTIRLTFVNRGARLELFPEAKRFPRELALGVTLAFTIQGR